MPLKEKFQLSRQYALDFLEMADATISQIREQIESDSPEKAVESIGEEQDGKGVKFCLDAALDHCRDMTRIGKLAQKRALDGLNTMPTKDLESKTKAAVTTGDIKDA